MMEVLFCGVRGSTPAPGAAFVRYGGHTSCIALGRDAEAPSLVLDAGTGLRRLSAELTEPFDGALLLTHLHWDHVQGLGFFPAADTGRVALHLPAQGRPAADVLAGMVSPPFFPLAPHELRGRWTFGGLEAGAHDVEGWTVHADDVPHGGGRTFGYRVSDGRVSVAYVPDHDPLLAGPGPGGIGTHDQRVLDLVRGVDVLIHDSMVLAAELPGRAYLGHASVEYAVALAEEAQVGRLALTHHDPNRTDSELDAALALARSLTPLEVSAAVEGDRLVL